jgi:hypothetical protein
MADIKALLFDARSMYAVVWGVVLACVCHYSSQLRLSGLFCFIAPFMHMVELIDAYTSTWLLPSSSGRQYDGYWQGMNHS